MSNLILLSGSGRLSDQRADGSWTDPQGAGIATWDWDIEAGMVTYSERWMINGGVPLTGGVPHVSSWFEGVLRTIEPMGSRN
ncbi:hypothetical protein [Petrachloros mirabilis]